MCADGSAYSYWVRKADPEKVVFFLQGGGACFDASTCALGSFAYTSKLGSRRRPQRLLDRHLRLRRSAQPVGRLLVRVRPVLHRRRAPRYRRARVRPDLTVQHKGAINATAALDDLAAQFPDATQIVVTGESAGSVPTPLYAGLAHDLPAEFGDHGAGRRLRRLPRRSGGQRPARRVWGTEAAIPPWPENSGLTAGDWGAPDLFVQAGKHDPEHHLRPSRLRLRLRPDDLLHAARLPAERSRHVDRRQRDRDRERRRRSAQLHRPGPVAHRVEQARVLHRDGRGRSLGRLGRPI